MNPTELKKEIAQLEQEKEQLLTKINLFKNKGDRDDFQALLEATSKLRKEQEQDARLNEKERELTQTIEMSEHQLLSVRQRLMDAQKITRDNLGPEQMLNNLRAETRQNRELANDVLGRELNDKRERLQRIEMLLQEPATTQSELERLTSDVKRLQREVMDLEQKIKQQAPADDKLAIYKSQANAVMKKKQQKEEEIRKLEVEKIALEKTMREREETYQKTRGSKYMKRDDFKQYAATLRVKNNQFKQMKRALDEIKAEVTVLDRTKAVLKAQAGDVEDFLKELEKKKGIAGYSAVEDQIQGVSEKKEELDNAKSKSMQELTGIVQQIDAECKEKKNRLAPEIKKLRTLRTKFAEVEMEYNDKKKAYDFTQSKVDSEKERLDKDMGHAWTEYKEQESRFHANNIQADVFEAFQQRIMHEAHFMSNPDKRLSPEFKSYQEFFNAKVRARPA